jgi:hypothetical protein
MDKIIDFRCCFNLHASRPPRFFPPRFFPFFSPRHFFLTTCGRASRDYACGIKEGDVIPTVNTLSNLFAYFKAMHTCHSKLRYFDWDGQVHLAKGKTGGQEGDPLERLIFNLTIHHLRGRVLPKFQEARAVVYADDGYISILPKGVMQ